MFDCDVVVGRKCKLIWYGHTDDCDDSMRPELIEYNIIYSGLIMSVTIQGDRDKTKIKVCCKSFFRLFIFTVISQVTPSKTIQVSDSIVVFVLLTLFAQRKSCKSTVN